MPLLEVFLLLNAIYCSSAQVGDSCRLKDSQQRGKCTLLTSCPQAERDAQDGISPTLCGFWYNNEPIVCCTVRNDPPEQPPLSFNNNNQEFVFPDSIPTGSVSSRFRKSEQKCNEYNRHTEDVVQVIPLVPHSEPVNISVVKCAFSTVPLIVGGEPAAPGEFPFMALIGFDGDDVDEKWRCGGTLVSEQYVMTAAHCTHSRDAGAPKMVRLGELDLLRPDDGSSYVDYAISKVIVHPQYRYPEKYNDIALIRLSERVVFTKFIRPACLYTKNRIEQEKGIATGWGKTDYLSPGRSYALLKVLLNFYDNSECSRVFKKSRQLPRGVVSSMLCVGDLRGGKDTCKGDSGGPLIITQDDNNCKFFAVGVTSFGKFCGASNTPAIYTKVSDFVDWIEDIIW